MPCLREEWTERKELNYPPINIKSDGNYHSGVIKHLLSIRCVILIRDNLAYRDDVYHDSGTKCFHRKF